MVFQQLSQEQQSKCDLLEKLPIPVAVYQVHDRQLLFANSKLEQLLEAAPKSLLGRQASFLFPNLRDRRKIDQAFHRSGAVRGIIVASRTFNNEPLWLSVWQERFECGNKECALCLLVDVGPLRNENEDLQEQLKEAHDLLQLGERDREMISFEIHDGVIQDMMAALMHLEAGLTALERGKRNSAELFDTARRLLRDGIKEGRRLIDGVRPPDLDSAGLIGALQTLVKKVGATANLLIELEHDVHTRDIPKHIETAIYRIVQESLTNVWRHSRSQRAKVRLIEENGILEVRVIDWGVGIDPARVNNQRFGLIGVRERARLLRGAADIQRSTPDGTGTTVTVRLPIHPQEIEADESTVKS